MHELLYLKDEQIKAFIEKIFIAYRESFSDSKATLNKHSLGLAHHKVIHLLSIYDGITISSLLKKLRITKQSLNRVLNDLIKNKYIFFEKKWLRYVFQWLLWAQYRLSVQVKATG